MSSVNGKVVLITGGANGVGAEVARHLHAKGANLVLTDLDEALLRQVAANLGEDRVLTVVADVRDLSAMEKAVTAGIERFGGIDTVVANAGIAVYGSVLNTDPAAFKTILDVNALGVFHTVRAALPSVIERRGYVLVVSSAAAYAPLPGGASYNLSKAGVEHFANALRLEVAHLGVDVGSAHMLWIDTPLVRESKSLASFREMIDGLPTPLNKTTSVEVCGAAFVKGIEGRKRQINCPGWVGLMRFFKPLLTSRLGDQTAGKSVPAILPKMDAEVAALGRSMSARTEALEKLTGRIGVLIAVLVLMVGCSSKGAETPATSASPAPTQAAVTPAQARAIAKDAYIYGFPMVDNYRVMYSYFVNKEDPEYKGAWNEVHSSAQVYTPEDKAIQTPNSDTPYSAVGADLRTEPLVLTVPPIEQNRYYSLQFVDLYTYNMAYVGSRTTGNSGGKYLLAGPNWKGEKPQGVNEVITSDTDLALVVYRTQLFGSSDIDKVKNIQAGYQVQPLSAYLNQPPPPAAPAVDFVPPLTRDQQKTSPQFFEILNFTMQFAPMLPDEKDLRARFATIGIGPNGEFRADKLSPEMRSAIEGGMADAWAELDTLQKQKVDTGEVGSAQFFGTAADLKGNYLYRMAGAAWGIYGNTAAEALYPGMANDSTGAPLTGADRYTVKFPAGQLPPVNAFWSLTMYEMPQSLLVANPIQRYLINSSMLSSLVADPDGGYTVYVQNSSPGTDKEANWLPAPAGPFQMVLRLYWPKPDALNGTWKAPKAVKA